MGTPLMIKPTLEECRLLAAKVGLPEIEAERFYNFYSSNGWRVGRNPMQSFPHAMANWKLTWQQRTYSANGNGNGHLSEADKRIFLDELRRVYDKIKAIKRSYTDNMSYEKKDRDRLRELWDRRDELMTRLGVKE